MAQIEIILPDNSKLQVNENVTAFDVELDRTDNTNVTMKITVMPSAKTKALWKMEGVTKLWFTVAQGEKKVGESEKIDIDALPETPILLKLEEGKLDLPSGALELQVQAFDSNDNWKAWIVKKTVQ